jgi:Stress responsive A/B Barrel Domain
MFVHTVFFWLKPDVTPAQRQIYLAGLKSLIGIKTVRFGHIGTPADTDRPIIERGYSYALVVAFDDAAGHDYYQVVDVHDRFRKECGNFWHKVIIYDSVTAS